MHPCTRHARTSTQEHKETRKQHKFKPKYTHNVCLVYTYTHKYARTHTQIHNRVYYNYKYSVDRGPLFLSFSLSLARAHERTRSPFLPPPSALCLSQPLSLLLRSLSPRSFSVFHFPSPLPPLSCSLCSSYRFSLIFSRIAPVQ